MKIKFYGTRGSIAVPGEEFTEFGGNTTCLSVTFKSGRTAVLDAGTGIRNLGNDMIRKGVKQFDNIFILLSHTHWDHIQGFPFFDPAFDSKRKITLAIPFRDKNIKKLQDIFKFQMKNEYFPVPLEKMGAEIDFWELECKRQTSPFGVTVTPSEHNHPGGAYGYRIEEFGKAFVFCTDIEHGRSIDANVVALSKNADLLIHDAQYTREELGRKTGWGHSSWEQAITVAEQANVRKLVLTHHDPEHDDAFLHQLEKECQARFPDCCLAREKMEIEL
jgi:phosphoribosyl 1,2-cyclic phosphodiesterase